ncbi:MAG TPA: sigma 54-interacting transcriptional regulator [Polyangia bacterium]|nr:sigma 54-interacting transcriptional regulator [Polyangia bacterium]
MSSGAGTTTISQAGTGSAAVAAAGLQIAWRFPNPHAPSVPLPAPGESDIVVGRDPTCGVTLAGPEVSRRHAALRSDGDRRVAIVDLGSRNGVRLNGRLVTTALLAPQDVVRVGDWIGVVTATPAAIEPITDELWGGAALGAALAPARQAAGSPLPVILQGETGTGKERVAEAIHGWSGRPGPFVAVNCAALPEGLAEAELFGYRRGAFTGADRASPGFFRAADRGSLLLDEVGDLPLSLQAKLLRVLEQREVQPLGETRAVPVDVRVIVAGQQPLIEAVRAGKFRAALLARLEGLIVALPPLRDRREDVIPLFTHLLASGGGAQTPALASDFAERLCVYDWPFNVREMVQLVKRLLVVRGPGSTLTAADLPDRMRESPPASPPGETAAAEPVQLPALVAALRASGGNVSRAAALMGISRQRAYRLMEAQAIDLESLRSGGEPRR